MYIRENDVYQDNSVDVCVTRRVIRIFRGVVCYSTGGDKNRLCKVDSFKRWARKRGVQVRYRAGGGYRFMKYFIPLVLALFFSFSHALRAESMFRCDVDAFVNQGDSIAHVLRKCGEPIERVQSGTREILVYRHPYHSREYALHIRNMKVGNIQDLGRAD